MKVEQRLWQSRHGWRTLGDEASRSPAIVLYFAAPGTLDDGARFAELRRFYPEAALIGCTTGGEIAEIDVHDGSVIATAIEFDSTEVKFAVDIAVPGRSSFEIGARLGAALPSQGLRNVFVLSDGTSVNGTELVGGIQHVLGREICLTGGLAGDGAAFQTTRVGFNANPEAGRVGAVGFYGDKIRIGHGSVGGWDAVGPNRIITRSSGNTLFDLDGLPALDLYKQYLGTEAANLPASALLFPLRIHPKEQPDWSLVRT